MRQLNTPTSMTPEEYVSIDDTEENGQQLTDDDILALANRDEVSEIQDTVDDDSTTEPEIKDITLSQARESMQTLIAYFEQ